MRYVLPFIIDSAYYLGDVSKEQGKCIGIFEDKGNQNT